MDPRCAPSVPSRLDDQPWFGEPVVSSLGDHSGSASLEFAMRTRRLRPYAEDTSGFSALKEQLLRRTVTCPLCARWNDPDYDPRKVCAVCGDTGKIAAWHALDEAGILSENEAAQVNELRTRLSRITVKCPYCHGKGEGKWGYPCPLCYREGTISAWESATLLM